MFGPPVQKDGEFVCVVVYLPALSGQTGSGVLVGVMDGVAVFAGVGVIVPVLVGVRVSVGVGVGWTCAHWLGAGASLRLVILASFFSSVPPSSAQ